jgi:sodium-dependent dicarboxylate transporter 2/3/5
LTSGGSNVRKIGLWLGPALALLVLLAFDLDPQRPETTRAAGVAIWMAVWWITEAVPLPVTALVPVVLFPLLGVMAGKIVAPLYFNSIIFLFLGGFMVALAMERWDLHKRIALRIILAVGGGPWRLVLGFMLASAFLSMWISNTATTMMMVPIAMAVIGRVGEGRAPAQTFPFAGALLLGTAYGASLGGIATPVGTPPNPLLLKNLTLLFPEAPEISFAQWFAFALPLSAVFMLLTWLILGLFFRLSASGLATDREVFRGERARLGPLTFEEKIVLADFLLLAGLWLSREGLTIGSLAVPGWSRLLENPAFVDDGTVAIGMALLLFLIPSRNQAGTRIMDWRTSRRLPWGIVLLFGGGFALAQGFIDSGLSNWLGLQLEGLSGFPPWLLVLAVCLLVTFLTELTSNTATTQMVLPIVAAVAVAMRVNPLLLMVPATLSASCAFMLPVATPPNAIIFGTDMVRSRQMAQVGLVLNLCGAALITACIYTLGRLVLGIDIGALPAWAE